MNAEKITIQKTKLMKNEDCIRIESINSLFFFNEKQSPRQTLTY